MMYGIIGKGSVTAAALTAALDQLNAVPTAEDEEFYFVYAHTAADANPKVNAAIAKWMTKTETYLCLVLPKRGAPDDALVETSDEQRKEADPYAAVLATVEEEEGRLLVLWDESDEVTAAVRQALAKGIDVLDLTDALSPIVFDEAAEAAEEEEDVVADDEDETPAAPAPRGRAKKAAAAPPPPAPRKRGRKTNEERAAAAAAAEAGEETPAEEEEEAPEAPAPAPRSRSAKPPVEEIVVSIPYEEIVLAIPTTNGDSTAVDLAVGKLIRAVSDLLQAVNA